jgi:hypothetical protein
LTATRQPFDSNEIPVLAGAPKEHAYWLLPCEMLWIDGRDVRGDELGAASKITGKRNAGTLGCHDGPDRRHRPVCIVKVKPPDPVGRVWYRHAGRDRGVVECQL